MSGGIALAIGPIVGALIGNAKGQPTAGLLLGFGVGLAFCVTLWLLDRRK